MILEECGLNLNRAYRELKPHGTLEFPCAGFSLHYEDNTQDAISWHWHEAMEAIYITEGNMKLQIPGKTFHLKEGNLLFINSNNMHYAVAEPSCKLHSLVFSPGLVAGGDNSVFANKYIMPLTGCGAFDSCLLESNSETGKQCINDFITAFEAVSTGGTGYEFMVREGLSRICMSMYLKYKQEIEAGYIERSQDNARTRKMLDYIHEYYAENIDLSDIAKVADIGERECFRCFQKVMQTSPIQYLLKYRIMQGASMLRKDVGSISHISTQCGFDSPSNFSQMFKRFFQCTPREYRKNY